MSELDKLIARKILEQARAEGAAAERERCCQIVREMCPECNNGVAEVRQYGPADFEAIECQRCGEVINAITFSAEEAAE